MTDEPEPRVDVPDDVDDPIGQDATAESPALTRRGFRARVLEPLWAFVQRITPRPKTAGGVLALIFGTLAVGAAITLGGVEVVHYSESVAFCTLCHTMEPQDKSYHASTHANVASCGQCHVTPGVAGFIYSRSGLGAKHGLTVAQGVGVIDPDYRGEIIVWLLNTADRPLTVQAGDRIAQLVLMPVGVPVVAVVEELGDTARGAGGFGHTGKA